MIFSSRLPGMPPLAERMEQQFLGECTARAFDLHAVEHDEQEHGDRHAEHDVQVGAGHDFQVRSTDA